MRALASALAVVLQVATVQAADGELLEKARSLRAALLERHVSSEGLVLYRMSLSTWRDDLRQGTYPQLADTPMFNGQWAASACARAEVEADPSEALDDARRALDGLRFLMDVTGVRGLMARGVRRDAGLGAPDRGRPWLPGAPGFERYEYRADVSADQYASGLLPAVAACAMQLPGRARALVVDFAAHLLKNDMRLVDARGVEPRFGDMSWRSGGGFNAIFQLTAYAAFAWAAELDPDPRWARQRDRLRDRYRVPARSRRTNLRVFGVTNYSNDLMSWNLYRALVPLARRTGDASLPELRHGMYRARLRARGLQNAYFAAVSCRIEPETCDRGELATGRALLAAYSTDRRAVLPDAAALAALPTRWLPARKWKSEARKPVPIAIRPRSTFEWKSSPFRVRGRNEPDTEYTGLDFLAAYWLYRALPASFGDFRRP